MPGLTSKTYGTGDYSWMLNTAGLDEAVSGVLDVSTFTKATHYPNGYFPSGLIVNIADPKAVKPFTGGAGEKLAFLMGDHETDGVEDRAGAFLFHGSIRTGFLPVSTNLPATAPNGFYFTAGV